LGERSPRLALRQSMRVRGTDTHPSEFLNTPPHL
jgi:hypothetical protein